MLMLIKGLDKNKHLYDMSVEAEDVSAYNCTRGGEVNGWVNVSCV